MLARIRKAREEEGFTLIELLVVMIIIGILAAIAIPVFLNQRKKAQDSAAKADVSTIGKEVATFYVDGTGNPTVAQAGGRYTISDGTTTTDIGKSSTNVVLGTANFVDGTHWCVDVTNAQGDKKTFKYSARGGLDQGACAAADVA
jgi:prepilin-type N-terminal cleavage/methylation domain-containing protein